MIDDFYWWYVYHLKNSICPIKMGCVTTSLSHQPHSHLSPLRSEDLQDPEDPVPELPLEVPRTRFSGPAEGCRKTVQQWLG